MTSDKEALEMALQNMKDGGGTSFTAALFESIRQTDGADMITNSVNKNRIILLPDGDDGDYARTRNLASL